jgi:ubiquinol-cytochrome c reductase cytochrome b subunit
VNARPFYFACGAALLLAAVTGAALSLSYEPSASHAWLSVLGLGKIWGGEFVRGVHRAASEAALVSAALAVAASLASRPPSRSARLEIVVALIGLALVAAALVTGNPLRNDNTGRFALSVETNVLGTLPALGGVTRRALLGAGPERTLLMRLFVRHAVLLPAGILLVAFAMRRIRLGALAEAAKKTRIEARIADLVAILVCVVVVAAVAFFRGAPLGAPADLGGVFPARPPWYFQPLYLSRQLLPAEYAPALTLLGMGALGAVVAVLLRSGGVEPSARRRRLRAGLVFGGVLVYSLGCLFGALKDARDVDVRASERREDWTVARVEALSRTGVSLEHGARAALDADPLHRARDLFSEHCANCHAFGDLGPHDGVARAPSLDGFGTRAWVLSMLDHPDAPERFGNTPFAGEMPSMTRPPADPALQAGFSAMPEADRLAVARFLSAEAGLTSAGSSLAELETGARIVRERCTSCHRFSGKTDDEESRAPELQGWGSRAWTTTQILNPRSGRTYPALARRSGEMPSFGGVLSGEEVALVVDLIRGALTDEPRPDAYRASAE